MDRPAFLYCLHDSGASVTATDSQAGRDPNDVLYATEDTYWKPLNVTGTKALVVDRNVTTFFNTISILGIALSGVTVEVRGSTDNFSSSNVALLTVDIESEINASWFRLPGNEYQYIKLNFSGFDSDLAVSFVCFAELRKLPYLESDYDPDKMEATGEHMVSAAGMYIGFNLQRNMAKYELKFGAVSEIEYNDFYDWRQNCVRNMNPFFFVPDVSEASVHFGWLDNASFSAPLDKGLRTISPISFMTRAN